MGTWNDPSCASRARLSMPPTRSLWPSSTNGCLDGPSFDAKGPDQVTHPTDGWAMLRAPAGDLKIEVQWEPHYGPPVWPSTEGEQLMMMHLDIGVDDLDCGVRWALAQGARLAEHQPQPDVRVMLDPEGHPFCLFPDDSL